MEVMVGSSFGIGMAACVRDRGGVSAQDKAIPAAALFLSDQSRRDGSQIGLASRIGLRMSSKSEEESSDDSSSSIGESSENEEEEEDDTVSSQGGGGTLDSFSSSLEDSLPIKRGLSNHYVGKSKSFGNLMEASNSNAKDLEKVENPFNKRRRLLIANKLRSRGGRSMSASNFYTWQNPNSMPLLALQELNEVDHHNDDDYEGNDQTLKLFERRKITMMMMKSKRDLMVQTRSCFCLSSLQEEDDDGDDNGGGNDDGDDNGGGNDVFVILDLI